MTAAAPAGIVFVVLGMLILRRLPRHGLGRLYLGIGLLLSAFGVTNGRPSGTALVIWLNSWAWLAAPVLLLTFGTFLLPDGRRPVGATGRWSLRTAVVALGLAPFALPYDLEPTPPPLAAWLPPIPGPVTGTAVGLCLGLATLSVVLSFATVVVRYRRGSPLDRQRLRWVALCTAASILIYVAGSWITLLPGITWDHVMAVIIVTPAVGVTTSIVRHRMFDIDRLVARTVSYAVVTVSVVAIYLGAVVTATAAVPSLGDSDLLVAVSTLLAAAAFRPLRRRVQRAVDHRFHRSGYDPEVLMGAFAARLRDEMELEKVVSELIGASWTTLRPRSISLWTPRPGGSRNAVGTLSAYNGP